MTNSRSIDPNEVEKFKQLASQWWDTDGPLRTLHDINPVRLEFIERHLSLPEKSLIDLGCGGGVLSEALAKAGAVVTGIDVAEEAIDVAKAHAQAAQLSIHYCCEPIEDYAGEAVDVVVCMEMLEHVSNPALVIEHAARLIKPGGYLFLSTINRTPIAYATVILGAEYLLNLLPKQTHDYNKFIKPSELSALVRHFAFEVLTIEGMRYNPWTHRAALQRSLAGNYLMVCRKV